VAQRARPKAGFACLQGRADLRAPQPSAAAPLGAAEAPKHKKRRSQMD